MKKTNIINASKIEDKYLIDASITELDNDFTSLTTTFSEVYLAKNVTIDFGTTLVLESNELDFDGTVFDFVIKLNNSDSDVDIIINIKKNGLCNKGSDIAETNIRIMKIILWRLIICCFKNA